MQLLFIIFHFTIMIVTVVYIYIQFHVWSLFRTLYMFLFIILQQVAENNIQVIQLELDVNFFELFTITRLFIEGYIFLFY